MRMLLSAGSLLVGPGGSCACHGNARVLRQRNDALRACLSGASNETKYPPRGLLHDTAADLGQRPRSASRSTSSNFGRRMAACLAHVRGQALRIVQEPHVAQLVELVVADDLRAHTRLHVCDVRRACRHGRDARARERHLAGGGELEAAVGVASFIAARRECRAAGLAAQARRRDDGCRRRCPRRCGNPRPRRAWPARRRTTSSEYVTPPGLEYFGTHQMPFTDASFGNKALHLVHVGPVGGHGNGDHLDAERLGHAEVPIVAGAGAQPLHLVKLAPRRVAQRAERSSSVPWCRT